MFYCFKGSFAVFHSTRWSARLCRKTKLTKATLTEAVVLRICGAISVKLSLAVFSFVSFSMYTVPKPSDDEASVIAY